MKAGFTLLELLVALAVLAVLASLSFRGLSSVLGAEARVREESRRWSEVGLLLGQLREDLAAAIEGRGFALGASMDAVIVSTRFADQPGAAPRRIGHRLRERSVEYLLWPQGTDSGPPAAAYAVLGNVAQMRFSALRDDGSWAPVWPVGQALPHAVAVELVLA